MPVQVKIKERSLIAKLAARKLRSRCVALVLGNTIHLHNTTAKDFLSNKQWLLHELKHVEQYSRDGFWRFLWKYLIESVKKGYRNNRYEVEARAAENDGQLLNDYIIITHGTDIQ